jgi:nucleoside-triphosphatase THEP1
MLKSATPCDLLVVDELGPLEFERREGWPAWQQWTPAATAGP